MMLKRIAKEIENYVSHPHPFVTIFPSSDITLWKMVLVGPKTTPYTDGVFILDVNFPNDYPKKAPEFRFRTEIYHININKEGRICHSIFSRDYDPSLSVRSIIDAIFGLILSPEFEDPL